MNKKQKMEFCVVKNVIVGAGKNDNYFKAI